MVDRTAVRVCEQVLLAHICDVGGILILSQQVIKWLVAVRAHLLRDRLVPFFAIGKDRVDIEDYAAKIEQPMPHYVTDSETRFYMTGGGDRSTRLAGKELSAIHS